MKDFNFRHGDAKSDVFGTDVMVNSAHAADSKESYERDSQVIRINENDLASIIEDSLK